jgi:hypothetical protein
MDKAKALEEDTKALDTTKKCIYDDERCGKVKLCGDCGLDVYESEQYQEAVDNYNIDRKIKLNR